MAKINGVVGNYFEGSTLVLASDSKGVCVWMEFKIAYTLSRQRALSCTATYVQLNGPTVFFFLIISLHQLVREQGDVRFLLSLLS